MSKDKKQEPTQSKELSEWQKRNREYLEIKAEEEAVLAEEREKERQARMGGKSKQSEGNESSESEADQEESGSDEEKSEEKVESSEDAKEEEKPELKAEPKTKSDQKIEKRVPREKPAKAKIPGVHILRALTILFPSLLLLLISAYLLSPYAIMKDIQVEGTVQTTAEAIRQASGIEDSDYTLKLLLDKAKYEEQIKANYWVESAQIVYQFPTKFTIKVKEYAILAYYVSGEDHYPILSSGRVESSPVSQVSLPETYLSVFFNDEQQVKTLSSELADVSPEIKQAIQTIELAPSSVTSDLLKLTMYDSDEILVPLSELGKKLPYYSKVKVQLAVPSLVDMEVGIYSYSLTDKALEEERIKAQEAAKEEERKKQEKKKQEEQSNQNQTNQRSPRR